MIVLISQCSRCPAPWEEAQLASLDFLSEVGHHHKVHWNNNSSRTSRRAPNGYDHRWETRDCHQKCIRLLWQQSQDKSQYESAASYSQGSIRAAQGSRDRGNRAADQQHDALPIWLATLGGAPVLFVARSTGVAMAHPKLNPEDGHWNMPMALRSFCHAFEIYQSC